MDLNIQCKYTYLQNRNRPTDIGNKQTEGTVRGRAKLRVWDEHIHPRKSKVGDKEKPTM